MADFAANFTARFKLRYSTLGKSHTVMFRIARGAGATGLSNMKLKVAAFLNALDNGRYTDWTMLGATYAPEDSDIFLATDVPSGVSAGLDTIPTDPLSQSCLATSFVGRSIAGQKARTFLYGVNTGPETGIAGFDNFRITSTEDANVAAAIAILNSSSPSIVASDGNNVVWYPYVNTKYNDYWVRRTRS